MKPNVRIWRWKPLVAKPTGWADGTFVLGTGRLPSIYFTPERLENLTAGWVRKGAWIQFPRFGSAFYCVEGVKSYDLLRRFSWK